MFKYVIMFVMASMMIGCTDGERGKIVAIGKPGHIECWSAGIKFYEGESTGKIQTEEQTDGWFFVEKGTDNLIRISGPCVIRN